MGRYTLPVGMLRLGMFVRSSQLRKKGMGRKSNGPHCRERYYNPRMRNPITLQISEQGFHTVSVPTAHTTKVSLLRDHPFAHSHGGIRKSSSSCITTCMGQDRTRQDKTPCSRAKQKGSQVRRKCKPWCNHSHYDAEVLLNAKMERHYIFRHIICSRTHSIPLIPLGTESFSTRSTERVPGTCFTTTAKQQPTYKYNADVRHRFHFSKGGKLQPHLCIAACLVQMGRYPYNIESSSFAISSF